MNICNCKESKKQQTIELTLVEAETIANFFGAVDACCDLKMTKREEKVWEKLVKRIKKLSQKDSWRYTIFPVYYSYTKKLGDEDGW